MDLPDPDINGPDHCKLDLMIRGKLNQNFNYGLFSNALLTLFARFIIGFFLGAIPWYIGAFLLLCARLDYREKPGFIACTLAVSLFISCNINSYIYFIFDEVSIHLFS